MNKSEGKNKNNNDTGFTNREREGEFKPMQFLSTPCELK